MTGKKKTAERLSEAANVPSTPETWKQITAEQMENRPAVPPHPAPGGKE